MNFRTLALIAIAAAPIAAHADAPSGDFYELFPPQATAIAVPSTRSENRVYVETPVEELVRASRAAQLTVEQVRAELATMPQPRIGA